MGGLRSRKDDLILKYEGGGITDANRAQAAAIREKLLTVQGLFKTIRRKIEAGDDAKMEGQQAEDLLTEIIKDLIAL